jgi:hypothetical protein
MGKRECEASEPSSRPNKRKKKHRKEHKPKKKPSKKSSSRRRRHHKHSREEEDCEDAAETAEWRRLWKGKTDDPSDVHRAAVAAAAATAASVASPAQLAADKQRKQAEEEAAGTRYWRRERSPPATHVSPTVVPLAAHSARLRRTGLRLRVHRARAGGEKVKKPKPSPAELQQRAHELEAAEVAKMDRFRHLLGQAPRVPAAAAVLPAVEVLGFSRGAAAKAPRSRSMQALDAFGELRNYKGQLK